MTGIPQNHPAMTDPYEYDNIVKNGYAEYMKPPTIINNNIFGGSGTKSPHEIEVDRASGNIDYDAARERGIKAGLIEGKGFADGGFVRKTGLALVHAGEPIIPADVANSSRLQNILENIAYGGSSTSSTVNNQPIIQITYQVDPKSGVMMDKISFERMVADIVAKRLRQLNGY